ncbi:MULTISPECIES: cysteine--tRNA ligase [Candidatus Ichthyocystis]|uniref:Cysteine--tRNA ligase n=1 Tax=Candidatus Ichthyocystis hellenicum TaxID=1561003 RepID=A0A0S4M3I9_9BURK|nr:MULTISPECIES: cysteine--tRNA ligase [Ichthyocystis]CUT17532.1 cysteinyl-tRNA synthetase [Candidatus Ichthyocystis hellenicum]
MHRGLHIYNTLSRCVEAFYPQRENSVELYVCGMTVYDYCHLGHARVFMVFDMVVRWLRHLSYDVYFIRNITDIDDKIITRASERGCSVEELTSIFIDAMHNDCEGLGIIPPSVEPQATLFVPVMVKMIGDLFEKGAAYVTPAGDVCFSVASFPEYGCLSGHTIEQLRSGHRVEADKYKKDSCDFVLWKRAKPGEPSWDSPWGPGRPGWHIECSAMSSHYLGDTFDIHGGGADLQFPHHENEIAQSRTASSGGFARYWMHNGFIRVSQQKMSKSLGNFYTIRDLLEKYEAEVIRFFLLRSHYRSSIDYNDSSLLEAREALSRLYRALHSCPPDNQGFLDEHNNYVKLFVAAMNNDFSTPEAFSVLFELANEVNRSSSCELSWVLKCLGQTLGLLNHDPEEFLGYLSSKNDDLVVEDLIEKRSIARSNKDWVEADRIRNELLSLGVILEDSSSKTVWRRLK